MKSMLSIKPRRIMYSMLDFAVVGLIAIALFSCRGDNETADAYGTFEVDEITISSKSTGVLLAFKIEEGEFLPADTVIGVVDTSDLHLQRAEISASLMLAGAQRLATEAQLRVTEREIEQLERDKQRIGVMYAEKAATQKQLDDINTAYDLAAKKLDVLRTQFPSINAQIENIRAKQAVLNKRIQDAIIINPVKGVVLTKYVEENELLTPGKPLYTIADMEYLMLKAFVSGPQLSEIKLGKKVHVYTDIAEGKMRDHVGTISWISNKAEFTPKSVQTRDERTALVYAIKVRVKNNGDLQIGMPAEVQWR